MTRIMFCVGIGIVVSCVICAYMSLLKKISALEKRNQSLIVAAEEHGHERDALRTEMNGQKTAILSCHDALKGQQDVLQKVFTCYELPSPEANLWEDGAVGADVVDVVDHDSVAASLDTKGAERGNTSGEGSVVVEEWEDNDAEVQEDVESVSDANVNDAEEMPPLEEVTSERPRRSTRKAVP
jgi:hypothetical protein